MEKVIIEGVVEHGRRLGRELGFPTANVAVPDSVAAEDGVYRSRAEVDGAVYDAMSNLGRNPSVGGTARRLETHIFGFSGALYGRMLRVELLEKIRDERRFDTLEELRAAVESGAAGIVTFTSASTVKGFVASVGEDADFSRMVGACIGAQTAAEARKHGIPAAVAREATMDALVELITALRD